MNFIDRISVKKSLDCLASNKPFQKIVQNIKAGKFQRDENNPDYSDRLIYTQELRNYVYNPGVMNCILSSPKLKTLFFRVFGYQGAVDFTLYPNCWLRDLPLLDIGEKVYLGDGILLGTNQVSPDQKSLTVGSIRIGDRCVFDQGCAIGYNSRIGSDCIIGFQVAIGLKNKIGKNVRIGGRSNIAHGCRIGNDVVMGDCCRIGSFSVIEDGVELAEYTDVPAFSLVTKDGIFSRRRMAS